MHNSNNETDPAVKRLIDATTSADKSDILESYIKEIINLQREFADFQKNVAQVQITLTGRIRGKDMPQLSDDLVCLIRRTTKAQRALHDESEFKDYGENDVPESIDHISQLSDVKDEGEIYTELARLDDLKAVSISLLDSKITTRNTRRSILLSTIAILVSGGILVASILDLL